MLRLLATAPVTDSKQQILLKSLLQTSALSERAFSVDWKHRDVIYVCECGKTGFSEVLQHEPDIQTLLDVLNS